MLLQLCTMWLEDHCRADPAYQKNSLSSRPPTMALSITASLHTSLGAESIAIIHRRLGMLLQLSTIWLEGHCRALPAYQRKSSSSRPPTMTLSITVPPHTSWCGINCDHSSTARNAPPTLHDMARGSLSCGPRVSKEFAIF